MSDGVKAFQALVRLPDNGSYYFIGSKAVAENGGYAVPLDSDKSHFEEGHEQGSSGETAMTLPSKRVPVSWTPD